VIVESDCGVWFISWIKELIAIATLRIVGLKKFAVYETNACQQEVDTFLNGLAYHSPLIRSFSISRES
jgi:hypothetical protein